MTIPKYGSSRRLKQLWVFSTSIDWLVTSFTSSNRNAKVSSRFRTKTWSSSRVN